MKSKAFEVGAVVKIDSAAGGFHGSAEILQLRMATGNHRTGQQCPAADVLRADGGTACYFLHDLARWNPDRLAYLAPAKDDGRLSLAERIQAYARDLNAREVAPTGDDFNAILDMTEEGTP